MIPSIFNDVIGPVMRGASSSHCAAALRIGRICRALMDDRLDQIDVEFDVRGSLATTHKSQGTDMGLFGGFLGWEAYDERLPESEHYLAPAGIDVRIAILDYGAEHPNTYRIRMTTGGDHHVLTAISTGGGMIEVTDIDGTAVTMGGDYYETLVFVDTPNAANAVAADAAAPATGLADGFMAEDAIIHSNFVQLKSQQPPGGLRERWAAMPGVTAVKVIDPVLPVLSRKNMTVPFITCEEMLAYNETRNLSLWELAVAYEAARGGLTGAEVLDKMREIVGIMKNAIQQGLAGTTYADRLLGAQSVNFRKQLAERKLIEGDTINRIVMYVSAMMEVKSSMGVIVAAPTAGSCGALPGAVLGLVDQLALPDDDAVKAMLCAGIIGVFIAAHATFAAEVGGCQAECGSGASMAAAGMVYLGGGNLQQSLSAASLALQNSLGMVCDPIANRVEAPCLGKNVLAASNAFSCANMALADYDHLIPLDQVIEAMDQVGQSMPHTLRCTNLGGLSITKAAKELEQKLEGQQAAPAVFFKSC